MLWIFLLTIVQRKIKVRNASEDSKEEGDTVIYVKDDKDFWWESGKAVIANTIQTGFLILFTALCWIFRKIILKIFTCYKEMQQVEEEYKA
jgi:hypothetical protein